MSSPTLLETDRTGPEANISRLNCNDKTTDGRNLVLWKDVEYVAFYHDVFRLDVALKSFQVGLTRFWISLNRKKDTSEIQEEQENNNTEQNYQQSNIRLDDVFSETKMRQKKRNKPLTN